MQKRAPRLGGGAVNGGLAVALLFLAMPAFDQTAGAASAAPAVTSVSPSTGSFSSEQAPEPTPTVTIEGTNFDGATHVLFGKFDAYSFTVVSSSEITAIPSVETLGMSDISVQTPAGASASSPTDQFTFSAPPMPTSPPVVTSITPSTVGGGPDADAATVELHGANFLYATSVQIGSTSVDLASGDFAAASSTVINAEVPHEPIGTVLDLTVTGPGGTSAISPADRITYVTPPLPPPTAGYWEVASDGGIFTFGNAPFYGSMGGTRLNAPVVGMTPHVVLPQINPTANGYWEVASDGGVFSFGGAKFFGSAGAIHLNKPIVAMASNPDNGGYWLVASDGGVFSFGDAPFYGSTGGTHLNSPIVGMALDDDGGGYWLAAADGSVYAFGSAASFGSVNHSLSSPVVGITADPAAAGYWLVEANGAVLSFGAAPNEGSAVGFPLNKPMVGMATRYNAEGDTFGYWEAASDGGIFTFGNTDFYGSTGGLRLNAPIVGIGATPQPLFPPFAP
jgi:hypothetical protein